MFARFKKFIRGLDPLVHIILIAAVVFLFLRNQSLNSKLDLISTSESKQTIVQVNDNNELEVNTTEVPENLLQQINDQISAAIATLSANPKPVIQQVVQTVDSGQQVTFVPLGTTGSTTSTDWVDIPGSETTLDANNEYGSDAYFDWKVSLKVAHANGEAFARIYDATNNIAVQGSEVSVVNKDEFTQVGSGQMAFWNGNNMYKVQMKSLNSFEVSYSSANIKATY